MIERLLDRLRSLLRRDAPEEDLADELRFHFDHQVEQYLRSGLSRTEAIRQAALTFGGFEQMKEHCRDERGFRWLEVLIQDAGYGLRLLRKQPGFTAAAVLILALGLGANTAMFSVVDTVLLKPLPFNEPERLTILTETNSVNRVDKTGASFPDYLAWTRQSQTFAQLAAYWDVCGDGMVFGGISLPERVRFSILTDLFPWLVSWLGCSIACVLRIQ